MKARAPGRQEENEKRCQSARAHCSESSAWSPMKRSRRVGEEARASRSLARSSSPHGPLLGGAVGDRLVVAIVVVAGPDSLPAPRCRLPTPARAAIEANASDERRRGKGEEAAIMESMETSERKPIDARCERKPIDARCKSWPERKAAGANESTAESGTAEPSADRRAAETAAHHSAAKATTHPAVKAPSVEAATPTHPGNGCG